ncbi:hypothetical protein ACFJIV_33045 [Mucilaginibacter sp. UC70_90]
MGIDNNPRNKSKGLTTQKEAKRDIYTSYNALAGKTEIKSVSQSMDEYIKAGFAKFKSNKKNS